MERAGEAPAVVWRPGLRSDARVWIARVTWFHMSAQVRSQDRFDRNASGGARRADRSEASASSIASENSPAVSAIHARPSRPYGCTTSRIDVDTTGLPAARYSGVFVGEMKRVESLRANGRIATSQPARYSGSSW